MKNIFKAMLLTTAITCYTNATITAADSAEASTRLYQSANQMEHIQIKFAVEEASFVNKETRITPAQATHSSQGAFGEHHISADARALDRILRGNPDFSWEALQIAVAGEHTNVVHHILNKFTPCDDALANILSMAVTQMPETEEMISIINYINEKASPLIAMVGLQSAVTADKKEFAKLFLNLTGDKSPNISLHLTQVIEEAPSEDIKILLLEHIGLNRLATDTVPAFFTELDFAVIDRSEGGRVSYERLDSRLRDEPYYVPVTLTIAAAKGYFNVLQHVINNFETTPDQINVALLEAVKNNRVDAINVLKTRPSIHLKEALKQAIYYGHSAAVQSFIDMNPNILDVHSFLRGMKREGGKHGNISQSILEILIPYVQRAFGQGRFTEDEKESIEDSLETGCIMLETAIQISQPRRAVVQSRQLRPAQLTATINAALLPFAPSVVPCNEFITAIFSADEFGTYEDNGAVWTIDNFDALGAFMQGVTSTEGVGMSTSMLAPAKVDIVDSKVSTEYRLTKGAEDLAENQLTLTLSKKLG